ncbi:MAG: HAD hydrolase family protein, partial [Candidatus Omnitrophica bacterium]|nr:HAD hydrolase family protein [Candidatus Omnitrophota bacterium]
MEKGIRVVIATGNPVDSELKRRLKGIWGNPNLFIAANVSTQIFYFEEGILREFIDYRKGLSKDNKNKISEIIQKFIAGLKEGSYDSFLPQQHITVLKEILKEKELKIEDRVTRLICRYEGFKEKLSEEVSRRLRENLARILREIIIRNDIRDCEVLIEGKTTIAVTPIGIDKEDAVHFMLQYFGIMLQEAIYFGDEFEIQGNDWPVVGLTGLNIFSLGTRQNLPINVYYLGSSPEYTLAALKMIQDANAQGKDTKTIVDILRVLGWAHYYFLEEQNALDCGMFRDYDYRTRGKEVLPVIAFYLGLTWAKMAKDKRERFNLKSNLVLVAKDCRRIDPKIKEALIYALRFSGLDVVDIYSDDNPYCVSSFSYALLKYHPLMSIFLTASHVTGDGVSGFKVTMQNEQGELTSLATQEIKEESFKIIEELLKDKGKALRLQGNSFGSYRKDDRIDEQSVRQVVLLVRLVEQGYGIYTLGREIEARKDEVDAVLGAMEQYVDSSTKPLEGLKILVEAAHTPSGRLAQKALAELGAQVEVLHPEIKFLSGMHQADPSRRENLVDLKNKIKEREADFGLAFDLDSDRCDIVYQRQDGCFESLSPDTLIVVLLPFLIERCGYDSQKIGKSLAVVRDVLGTEAVDNICKNLQVDVYQTDAGYVFLKAKVRELKNNGFVVPIYGESSGHAWLDVTGPIENPLAIAILFALIIKEYKNNNPNIAYLVESCLNKLSQRYSKITFKRSGKINPPYQYHLLNLLYDNYVVGLTQEERTRLGIVSWNPRENDEDKKKIPQVVVAYGKDYCIRNMLRDFIPGKTIKTKIGDLTVDKIDAYAEGNLYRYIDIRFMLNNEYIGRFIFRASANEPNFVLSFEAVYPEGVLAEEGAKKRFVVIGGVVLDYLDTMSFAPLS